MDDEPANATTPLRRALVGASVNAPIFGGLAAWSTIQLVQRGGGLTPQTLGRGLLVGALRSAPFAVGGALYYPLEFEARSVAYRFADRSSTTSAWAKLFGARGAAAADGTASSPLSQYERMFGPADRAHESSTPASKALAGVGASFLTMTGLFLLRWPGFRSFGTVLGLAAGCGLAAPLMPDYDDVEKRSVW